MKLIYRILILLGIFIGSLYYFGTNMTEKVFSVDEKTMDMQETTLPYISLLVDGQEFNLLHGYCSSLDELTVRESITPLSTEQSFGIIITENESTVKKVKYEVIGINDGKTIEEGAINALDTQPEYKLARIKLKESLTANTEYVLKITLITDSSKRVYYYTRIKVMPTSYLQEKIAFVNDFHAATLSKETSETITKYLEKPYLPATNFARVTIQNDYDTVTYGTLSPTELFRQIPTISEIGKDTASITLSFMLSVETNTGLEYYHVKEHYRFMYTASRCYLYDYDREMESVFDVSLTSLAKSEFKVGLTNHPEMDLVTNADKSTIAFVRERALWCYSVAENKMTDVFSFYQGKTDFIRDTFDQHDIRILKMDAGGNIDFIVYGYMNRGEYEGRVGIVLYHYDRTLQRVEEQLYIPINTTYELLKEQIGIFCYRNDFDVFYLQIFDKIYSYNLTAKALKEIATGVTKDSIVFSRDGKFVAYQELGETMTSPNIKILDLDSGETKEITEQNKPLRLLGLIDQNIIYGVADINDIVTDMDGTKVYPMSVIRIVDSNNQQKKVYHEDGYYIIDATVNDNVIELKRITMNADGTLEFANASSDFILNTATENTSKLQVTKRVTDMMLTEYYITMNLTTLMKEDPQLESTKNLVITEDTTVRINQSQEEEADNFIAYAFGEIVAYTSDIGEAILAADSNSGIVLSSTGNVVWERGVRSTKSSIDGIGIVPRSENVTSLQACIRMLLSYRNTEAVTDYNRKEMSVVDYLNQELPSKPVKAENITLNQALYFVYKGKPVIAFKATGATVLLVGYDSTSITVIDPVTRAERKMAMKEASTVFENGGNIFITYVE